MSARVLQGVVVSDKMDKTVVVTVAQRKQHRLYRKVVTRTHRYKAHDGANECRIGDLVRILEARPQSKEKRWRVIEILQRGDVAEIAPTEIGRELEETTQVAPKAEAAAEAEAEASTAASPPEADAETDAEAENES